MTDHEQMLDDCEARDSRLSDWERGFLDSLRDWLVRGRTLTPKQAERLEEIWERATAKG